MSSRKDLFRFMKLRAADSKSKINPDKLLDLTPGEFLADLKSGKIQSDNKSVLKETLTAGKIAQICEKFSQTTLVKMSAWMMENLANPKLSMIETKIKELYGPTVATATSLSNTSLFRSELATALDVWLLYQLLKFIDQPNRMEDTSIVETATLALRFGFLVQNVAGSDGRKDSLTIIKFLTADIMMPALPVIQSTAQRMVAAPVRVVAAEHKPAPLTHRYTSFNDQLGAIERLQKDIVKRFLFELQNPGVRSRNADGQKQKISIDISSLHVRNTDPNVLSDVLSDIKELYPSINESNCFQVLQNLEDAKTQLSVEANEIFYKINSGETAAYSTGVFRMTNGSTNTAAIKNLGFADLMIVQEKLKSYRAADIAYIENVLPKEERERLHVLTQETELSTESNIETTNESEKDLQSSEKFELQLQTERSLKEDLSATAGLKVTGSYGVSEVTAELGAQYAQSKEESNRSASKYAKDVVSRAVEKTRKQVREARKQRTLVKTEETNRHKITGTERGYSGVYRWVDAIHEVELRHYGTRLMIEMYIPEPGMSLLNEATAMANDPTLIPPPPFNIEAKDITSSNFMAKAKMYEAIGVEPPPLISIAAGYTYATTPKDSTPDTAEDTNQAKIKIPEGYSPIWVDASVTGHSEMDDMQIHVAIAGQTILEMERRGSEGNVVRPLLVAAPTAEGLPVTTRISAHYDKTAVVNVNVVCLRLESHLMKWQLQTLEKLREGYRVLQAEYERKKAQRQILGQNMGRSPSYNRLREKEELRKWSIFTMRNQSFNFDAVSNGTGGLEVDLTQAASDQKIVSFFEQAFEWDQMTYELYPYYWGRKDAWNTRNQLQGDDLQHLDFLRAGAARVLIPVRPSFEDRVLNYIDTIDSAIPEIDRVTWTPTGTPPTSSSNGSYWVELLTSKRDDLIRGSGFLSVTHNSNEATLVESTWQPTLLDVSREVIIEGASYHVMGIATGGKLILDRNFAGETSAAAVFAIGSVRVGEPWEVRIPTPLVVLGEEATKVEITP